MNSDRVRQVATLPSFFEDAKSLSVIPQSAIMLEDSAKEILQNMNVANFADICYSAQYTGSQTLKALEICFPLGLDRKLFLPKDLNAIRRKKV